MTNVKSKKRKAKKRIGFHTYFMMFVSAILVLSISGSILLENVTSVLSEKISEAVWFIIVGLFILSISGFLTWFVIKYAISPIKKVRDAMNKVAEGNFDISLKEESRFNEIQNINHSFNIMTKELRATEIIQSDFIANVSHEFKTPLTAINGYACMIKDSDLSLEEKNEYADKIVFNSARLSELVNNILLLCKLDNQETEKNNEDFFVDEQIRESILLLEPQWSKKNIEFDIQCSPVLFNGNKQTLTHVWNNLIGNAIKFTPDSSKITINLKKAENQLIFSVADEGSGIKENEQKHIFNKFYQADSSHKQEGNGLGLSLVKKIVDNYLGEVYVENLFPKGCKFTVKLPCQ